MCVRACVCVCVREGETQRERAREREAERERERERERNRVRERTRRERKRERKRESLGPGSTFRLTRDYVILQHSPTQQPKVIHKYRRRESFTKVDEYSQSFTNIDGYSESFTNIDEHSELFTDIDEHRRRVRPRNSPIKNKAIVQKRGLEVTLQSMIGVS